MGEQYLGEVRIMAFGYPPRGWAQCDGQILGISQNQALFAILGTTFGGDGVRTFALPDLRGRAAMSQGRNYAVGSSGGEETHTLAWLEVPQHTHFAQGSTINADQIRPERALLGASNSPMYHYATKPTPLNPATVGQAGSGQAHPNMAAYLALNFCIATTGIWPSRQ
jgi:microcystin-dependent protein